MEEKFIVSARKYRPLTFDSVVGQKAVTNTLLNAIKNNQLAQAFLFCGPRGVGKTTCARILAKAVNAQDPENLDVELDSFNVFELDAASNNSVDDVRKLVEQVRIAPAGDVKYKVYIIDEVHMLSTSAFNAFLKTLEEPPAYAIFVLATTEKHKIIPTILSRCQVFDFSRISTKDIANHLASIAEKEGVKADIDALMLIAQKADGGLRDALSIFDQMVAFTGKELTHSSVAENLNVLDIDTYFGITNCVLNQDIPSILNAFNDIINKGFDPNLFIVGLGDHFRNLLLAQEPKLTHVLDLGENLIQRYTEEGPKFKRDELIEALDLCSKTDNQYKQSKNQHLLVELCLMQLCSLQEKKKADA